MISLEEEEYVSLLAENKLLKLKVQAYQKIINDLEKKYRISSDLTETENQTGIYQLEDNKENCVSLRSEPLQLPLRSEEEPKRNYKIFKLKNEK